MFPYNLTTNEVKNSAGAEVEFLRYSSKDREIIWNLSGELPSLQHRISIRHTETGTGAKRRRRSALRIDKQSISAVDAVSIVTTSAYAVSDIPVGHLNTLTEATTVMAELNSLLASQGASTTILFDGSGYGAAALINGTL